ncbi:glycoside hydrolase family 2 protein [Leifsonia shinshuensis]|uniref:beta-mannosidase n=1 Tax=Leifsonia shinshuensis TaxID=150026 RepID=A0A7G6YD56_9MICO|nr:glycoside hydrolase family 2 protein [Leifsonia shinshuensis]QNE36421.1 glycoside hydrolase family 2 protein [Leifsonia shinshuensis]
MTSALTPTAPLVRGRGAPVPVRRSPLSTGWTLRPLAGEVPDRVTAAGPIAATVPGSVHTDLLAAGLIEDPYLDRNEELQRWIGLADWGYRVPLDWTPDGSTRQEIVFEGLDTVAEILLNGETLARTRNMHRTYRLDVTGRLLDGANELEVRFASPVRAADAASLELGYRPHTNHHPYNALRKMACGFGWDWGIDTASSGIWRPARLETWDGARIRDTRVSADVVDGVPTLTADILLDRDDAAVLEVEVRIGDTVHRQVLQPGRDTAHVVLRLPDAALWYPVGHGDAALHDLRIALTVGGVQVDQRSQRVGFRSVSVLTEPDESGTGFRIVVNGATVLVRGANWIPDDAFPHRVDRARYAARLTQAQFAGVNLLRVWGGGVFESDDFFAECDERGILAWQDFLFACAAYAEEEPLWSEVEAEARDNIVRLAAHPSLVVLNGNNENSWGRQDWGWDARLDGRTWGAGYYYDLLPGLVAELAPHVAYTPGSPFSPDPDAPQNDPAHGTVHIWDLWNEKDHPHYRDYRPRFVAEFGWQGPPTWSTLTASLSDDPLTPESPGMILHQKAIKGNDKLTDGLVAHFPLPDDMADWHWAMSLNQAVAVRTAVEWFRSLTPTCTGSIVWQLNDCWPVTSWAAVDGYGRRKPLLYALRHAHRDRLLTVQPDGDGLLAALVNDTADGWDGTLEVERRRYDGQLLARSQRPVTLAPRSALRIALDPQLVTPRAAASEVVVLRFGGRTAHWFFTDYRHSALSDPGLSVHATPTHDGWIVAVQAKRLVRDLMLLVDRVDPEAVTDEALLTLLPGERVELTVTGAVDADPALFADQLVLRSANQLVAARPRVWDTRLVREWRENDQEHIIEEA